MSKNKEMAPKFIEFMLKMMGADIITPEPIAKPIIDKVESSEEWQNLQVAIGNSSENSRKNLIAAVSVKFLTHSELLALAKLFTRCGENILDYVKEHPDDAHRMSAEEMAEFISDDTED